LNEHLWNFFNFLEYSWTLNHEYFWINEPRPNLSVLLVYTNRGVVRGAMGAKPSPRTSEIYRYQGVLRTFPRHDFAWMFKDSETFCTETDHFLYNLDLKDSTSLRVTEVRSKILTPLETTGGNSFSLERFEKIAF